jgi:Tol biopolymer transport system component
MKKNALTIMLLAAFSLTSLLHAQPAEPPLVGALLAATTSEQDRIILYDIGTGGQRSLSFGTGWHDVWGFSPDGCRVIFTLSDGAALAKLYSARLDGTDERELVQFDELPADKWGVWEPQPSPTEDRIVFTMIQSKTGPEGTPIYEHRIAWVSGEGGAPDFYSVTGDEAEPEWSPDGRWLVYMSYTPRVPGLDVNATAAPTPEGTPVNLALLLREADLWMVSADAASKYQLTNFPTGSVRAPHWSPDSELVSFVYSPSPNNETFWMIANAPEAIPTQLSTQFSLVMDTTWFPDSTAILAAVRDFQLTPDNFLWTIPLVGGADVNATRYLPDPNLAYADYPRFSADGKWLALRSAYNLALVDVPAGTWRLLDEQVIGNTPPVWSPAGFKGETACTPNP